MNLVITPPRFAEARLHTGVRLRYAEQGDPAGHAVILLHGYTDSSFSFSRVLPLLDASYHVYALDQRGHGDSERPAGGYALRDFAADVVAFMDELGLESATLAGHCMGSLVAQRVAIDAPRRVARLALVSSMTAASHIEGIFELQQAAEAFGDLVPPEFARDFQAGTVYGPVPADFMEGVVAESLKVPARVWRATLAGLLADDHTPRLDRIRTPTLILWGEQDALLRRGGQDTLLGALANADLKVYPETGHSPHWERPERVVRDLEAFIARAETG
ncbi:MAG TPA: alpha/beta fold hydrolase [Pyrinomonadaceae bacterium]|jgi:pimeloyl-ACP methyl ester carboxylesterase|nr:alpha/beta fold hydrolase [Pyrinomonadaceae bacterium]